MMNRPQNSAGNMPWKESTSSNLSFKIAKMGMSDKIIALSRMIMNIVFVDYFVPLDNNKQFLLMLRLVISLCSMRWNKGPIKDFRHQPALSLTVRRTNIAGSNLIM